MRLVAFAILILSGSIMASAAFLGQAVSRHSPFGSIGPSWLGTYGTLIVLIGMALLTAEFFEVTDQMKDYVIRKWKSIEKKNQS